MTLQCKRFTYIINDKNKTLCCLCIKPCQSPHSSQTSLYFFSISRTIPDPGSQKLNWHKAPLTVLVVKKIYDESILDPFKEVIAWLIEVILMITAHAMRGS